MLWRRFLLLGWLGRLASLAVALYGMGWLFGTLSLDGAAHQLGELGIFVFGVLLAAGFIKLVWKDATAHHRWPR